MFATCFNSTRRLSRFGLAVALVFALFVMPRASVAQETARPSKPTAPLPADPPVAVAVGSSSVLPFDPVVEGLDVVDRTVCNVRQIRRGVIVQGLKIGKTRVTMWGEGFGIKTFDVTVLPDRAEVLARLLQKYPESNLRLTPSPETGKVIVEGTLPSAWAVEDVLQQLEGADLTRSQILNRLSYLYAPVICPPVCGATCYPVRCRRR